VSGLAFHPSSGFVLNERPLFLELPTDLPAMQRNSAFPEAVSAVCTVLTQVEPRQRQVGQARSVVATIPPLSRKGLVRRRLLVKNERSRRGEWGWTRGEELFGAWAQSVA